MELLIDTIFEALNYIPSNLIYIGIISYLLWFNRKHTREHQEILSRLSFSENTDLKVDEKLNDIYMMSLKTAITNIDLPITVRLELYDEYKGLGGNSWVDIYVREHLVNTKAKQLRRKTDPKEEKE
jgi:hypothetical protein